MARCYLMLEDRPSEKDGEFELGWAAQWGTEDGLEPPDEEKSDAQWTLRRFLDTLEYMANSTGSGVQEGPSTILMPTPRVVLPD